MDYDAKRVYKNDKEVKLSATEYKLLEILL